MCINVYLLLTTTVKLNMLCLWNMYKYHCSNPDFQPLFFLVQNLFNTNKILDNVSISVWHFFILGTCEQVYKHYFVVVIQCRRHHAAENILLKFAKPILLSFLIFLYTK